MNCRSMLHPNDSQILCQNERHKYCKTISKPFHPISLSINNTSGNTSPKKLKLNLSCIESFDSKATL